MSRNAAVASSAYEQGTSSPSSMAPIVSMPDAVATAVKIDQDRRPDIARTAELAGQIRPMTGAKDK